MCCIIEALQFAVTLVSKLSVTFCSMYACCMCSKTFQVSLTVANILGIMIDEGDIPSKSRHCIPIINSLTLWVHSNIP